MPAPLAPLNDLLPLDVDGSFKQRNTQKAADAVAQFEIDQQNQTERNAKGRGRTIDHGEETIDASDTTIGKLYQAGTSSPMELLGQKLDEPGSVVRDTITGKNDATGLDVAKAVLPNVANLGPAGQAAAGFVAGAVVDPLNFVGGGGAAKGASRLIPKTPVAPTFYSPLQRFVASGKVGNSFTPDQLRGQLAKAGVTESEIHWTGLEDVLAGKTKVTKAEVLDHLAENEIQVETIVKSENAQRVYEWKPSDDGRIQHLRNGDGYVEQLPNGKYRVMIPGLQSELYEDMPSAMAATEAANTRVNGGPRDIGNESPKFSDPRLQLPGGTNYREVLLTLPRKADAYDKYVKQMEGQYGRNYPGNMTEAESATADRLRAENGDSQASNTFTQGHFDEPNVMAHLRLTDREIGGKKSLFVEEAQSDHDLLARKEGIKDAGVARELRSTLMDMEAPVTAALRKMDNLGFDNVTQAKQAIAGEGLGPWDIDAEHRALLEEYHTLRQQFSKAQNGVPDFPFRGKWHELAIKRVLRMAAEEGYDSIAWTTGRQQAERYNLAKQIDTLNWHKDGDGYRITAKKDGNILVQKSALTPAQLADHIGKDVAEKITNNTEQSGSLSGLDLSIGGEGKNTLYDEIIPSFLNKYGKRWNARAGKASLREFPLEVRSAGRAGYRVYESNGAFVADDFKTQADAEAFVAKSQEGEAIHHFPIPDSLRKSVLEDGQSLFGSSFQAVHEFVGTLDPKQQQEIITALQGADAPKWLKRMQGEEGGIQTAAAWLLTRMAMGFTAGALTGDPENVIENGLMGAGLFGLASPRIVKALADIVRKQQPNPAVDMNPQAAVAAGHTVGEVGHVPIDWDAVEATADGAKALIQKIADYHIKASGGKRGHITVEETLSTSKALGMNPDEFERWMSTSAGVAMNREQLMYGAMTLADSQAKNVPAKIAAYAKAGRVPGSVEDVALTNARVLHNEISKQLFGGREEAGGALQILGREPARSAIGRENAMVSEADNAALTPGKLPAGAQGPEVPEGTGILSVPNDAYIKIWQAIEDKGALERSTRNAEQVNGWDMLNELIYGDALSSPITHIQNVLTSSGFNPVASAMVRAIASTKARLLGDTSGVVPGEAAAMMHGYFTGVHSALTTVRDTYHEGGFMQLWSDLHSLEERGKLEGSGKKAITSDNLARILGKAYGHDIHIPYNKPYSFDPNGYIGQAVDIFGTAIRTPSQLLKVGDRFSYAINFNMASEAAAWRKAVQSGAEDPAELAGLYQQNLARMPQDIKVEAEKFAKHEIFQEAITGYPGKMVEGLGHPIMRPFITFVRTPINIMKYNLEGTPLANRLVKSVRDDYAAGGARAQLAQAKMILGGSITGLAGIMAWSGRLTGAGPEDPSVRKIWLDAGNLPYSVNVIGTLSKPVWWSYRFMEPFATWGGMAADAVYGWHHEASNVQSFIYGVLPTVAMNSFTNKTWTKDAMELFAALKSQAGDTPDTKAARWEAYAKSRVKSLVPGASGLSAVTRATDPVMHEAVTLWETLKKGIPWLSSTLPPSYDIKGNVRTRESLGPDIISPIQVKSGKRDKVLDELWKNGVAEPPFPKVVAGLEVTAKEKSQLQKLRATLKSEDGYTLYEKLNEITHDPDYLNPDLTNEGRKAILAPILHGYTNMAMAELGKTNPKFSRERAALEKAHKRGYEKGRPASDFELNP